MPGDERLVPAFKVAIDGADAGELNQAIIGIRVGDRLGTPSKAQLQLSDVGRKVTKSNKFKPGGTLDIQLGFGSQLSPVFKGEIVGLEVDLAVDKPARLLVIARDKQHRLHRGTKTETYKDVKDSDLATKIAQKHGLSPDVEDSGVVHPFVLQNNLPDYEFLALRATLCGYHFWVDDRKLYFKKSGPAQSATIKATWGESLQRFWQEVNLFDQVSTVDTHAFDPKQKKEIKGPAKKGDEVTMMGSQMTGAQMVKKWFGDIKHTFASAGVALAEMEALAKGEFNKRSARFITAQGRISGNPKVSSGAIVEIEKANKRLDGTYYVTEAQHLFYTDVGYSTEFTCLRYGIGKAAGPQHQKDKQAEKVAKILKQIQAKKDKDEKGKRKEAEKEQEKKLQDKKTEEEKGKTYWLEFTAVDKNGQRLPFVHYTIRYNDEWYKGLTDEKGHVRIDILPKEGAYEVWLNLGQFPDTEPRKIKELETLDFTVVEENGKPAGPQIGYTVTGPDGIKHKGKTDDKSHVVLTVPKGDYTVEIDFSDTPESREQARRKAVFTDKGAHPKDQAKATAALVEGKDKPPEKKEPREIKNAAWSQDRAAPGDKVKLKADAPGVGEGETVEFKVIDAKQKIWEMLKGTVKDRKVETEWTAPDVPELHKVPTDEDKGKPYVPPKFFFTASWQGKETDSRALALGLNLQWDAVDEKGKALSDDEYTLTCADGSVRQGKLAGGKLKEFAVPVGWVKLVLKGFGTVEFKNK